MLRGVLLLCECVLLLLILPGLVPALLGLIPVFIFLLYTIAICSNKLWSETATAIDEHSVAAIANDTYSEILRKEGGSVGGCQGTFRIADPPNKERSSAAPNSEKLCFWLACRTPLCEARTEILIHKSN